MATILIVDDGRVNREYLSLILEPMGHRLLKASDGEEALEVIRRERPDLVISDILMPTMDGYELLRQLRSDPALRSIPVIFYTAHYHEEEARVLAQAWGVCEVLFKGCEPDAVLSSVQAGLRGEFPAPTLPGAAGDFDRAHRRLLTDKLAQNMDELRKANERLRILHQFDKALISGAGPAEIAAAALVPLRELLGAARAVVNLFDLATGEVEWLAAAGRRRVHVGPGVRYSIRFMGDVEALRRGEPQLIDVDALPPGPEVAALLASGVHSYVVVPMSAGGELIGALSFGGGAVPLTAEQLNIAQEAATQFALALAQARLHERVKRQAQELEVRVAERTQAEEAQRERARCSALSGDIGLALTGPEPLPGMLQQCAESMVRNLKAAFARIWTLNEAENMLELQASAGMYTHLDGPHARVPVGKFKIGLIAQERSPRLTNAVVGDPCVADQDWAVREGMVAFAGYPLLVADRLIGVVALFARQTLSDATMQALAPVADQIALGIDRKHAEKALRAAQQRLQHVVVSSPAVLFTVAIENDRMRGISWMSDNILDMLGYPMTETHGGDWWMQHVHPDDFRSIVDTVQQSLFGKGFCAQEYRFQHRDGSYRWIRSEIRLLRDAAGKPLEAVGSWSDITERKQLEEQYRQAQKMEAVGRLAGGVAHDFNNLLTVIMGYSEIYLGKLRPEDPLRAALTEIHKAGERATGLTRQLLAFSRKQVLMPVVLDLNAIIAEMEKMLGRLIGEDVILTVCAGADLWKVKADPGQMEQVVMNILVNARDAMPQGGKLLLETRNVELDRDYVQTHPEANPGDHIRLAISDNGCGMDASVKARLFEPFFTTKGPTKGTGLGLATVFGIVKQSGGHVEVYSEVGQGTTFKIYLPRDQSGAPIASLPRTKEPVRGGTETILLVEDEEGVRNLTRTVLQQHGYTVLDAMNGGDALMICETHSQPIDLLITDVVMPHFGGRQLAERLATRQPTMKVLYMSGYTDDAIVHHGVLEAEMLFLQKPFTPEALARKVRDVLDDEPVFGRADSTTEKGPSRT